MHYKIQLIMAICIWGIFSWSCQDKSNSDTGNHEEATSDIVTLSDEQQQAIGLVLGRPEMNSLQTNMEVSGKIALAPQDKSEASLFVGGNVWNIAVKEGDFVKKGQALATFRHPDYIELQQAYQKVSTSIGFLKQEFERKQELYDNGISSGKDFQKAASDYQAANIDLKALKEKLLLLGLNPETTAAGNIQPSITLRAPISGYINHINIKTGQYASPQQSLFEIDNPSNVYAVFQIYEQDLAKVKTGQHITFTTESYPEKLYESTIYSIGKTIADETQSTPVYARINNTSAELLPDQYITGRINIEKDSIAVPTIPTNAIIEENGKKYVFVYNPASNEKDDGTKQFRLQEIATGYSNKDLTEVKSLSQIPEPLLIVTKGAYYVNSERTKSSHAHDD